MYKGNQTTRADRTVCHGHCIILDCVIVVKYSADRRHGLVSNAAGSNLVVIIYRGCGDQKLFNTFTT